MLRFKKKRPPGFTVMEEHCKYKKSLRKSSNWDLWKSTVKHTRKKSAPHSNHATMTIMINWNESRSKLQFVQPGFQQPRLVSLQTSLQA